MSALNAYAKPLPLHSSKFSLRRFLITATSRPSVRTTDSDGHSAHFSCRTGGFSGVSVQEVVNLDSGKLRLDAWIASRINGISRARVQSSIRSGLVSVNGRVISKVSHVLRDGDAVDCTIEELKPLRAEPEDIPLDIVYEDDYVLVVNKPAHMVVHPAPGNATGTLVNGILFHYRLSTISFLNVEAPSDAGDVSADDAFEFSVERVYDRDIGSGTCDSLVRPGIVHRLDKGTSGLIVVAKDELSHAHLAEQFKKHTIKRVYVSLTCGVPSPTSGHVDIPISRDVNSRIRMIAIPRSITHGKARHAVSRYKVIEVLARGSCALVEWRLETGRTHQIRAHAKYLGVPLLGDDVYGGTKNMALSLLQSKNPSSDAKLLQLVSMLERPCLHALSLGFEHPHTGEHMFFSQIPPTDFGEILNGLQSLDARR